MSVEDRVKRRDLSDRRRLGETGHELAARVRAATQLGRERREDTTPFIQATWAGADAPMRHTVSEAGAPEPDDDEVEEPEPQPPTASAASHKAPPRRARPGRRTWSAWR